MPLVSRNVRDADPEQPISNERTLEEIVQANIAPRCVQVRIIAAFAALELLPAGIGLHGLRNLGFGPPGSWKFAMVANSILISIAAMLDGLHAHRRT